MRTEQCSRLHSSTHSILLVQLKSATTLETRKGACRWWFTRKTKYIQLNHLYKHFFLLLVPVELKPLYSWTPQAVCPILKVPKKVFSSAEFKMNYFKWDSSKMGFQGWWSLRRVVDHWQITSHYYWSLLNSPPTVRFITKYLCHPCTQCHPLNESHSLGIQLPLVAPSH